MEIFKKSVSGTGLGQIDLHFTETLVNDNNVIFPGVHSLAVLVGDRPGDRQTRVSDLNALSYWEVKEHWRGKGEMT